MSDKEYKEALEYAQCLYKERFSILTVDEKLSDETALRQLRPEFVKLLKKLFNLKDYEISQIIGKCKEQLFVELQEC